MSVRNPFWQTTPVLLRYKPRLAAALACALVSSACFGAGLGMLLPMNHVLLSEQQNLQTLIQQYTGASQWALVRHAGSWLSQLAPADRFAAFVWVMLIICGLTMISAIARYLHAVLVVSVVEQTLHDWRMRLNDRMVRAPWRELVRCGASDWITHVARDCDVLGYGYRAMFERGMIKLLNGVFAMAFAFWLNWQLSLLAVVGAPVAIVAMRRGGRRIRRATSRALHLHGSLLNVLKEMTRHFRVVKVYHTEQYEHQRFESVSKDLMHQQRRSRNAAAASRMATDMLAVMGVAAICCIAAWDIFRRNVSAQEFMTVLVLLIAAAASLQLVTRLNNQLQESTAAAARMLQFMSVKQEALDSAATALSRHNNSIAFEQVTYSYSDQQSPALSDVSWRIEHGQMAAIVGGNGSGKTTLLSLLPRLIEPTAGRVTIDGHDLSQVDLTSLRAQISVVTQQPAIFQGSIAQNIAYGRDDMSQADIEQAALAAHADEFIALLPDGYDTLLGEDGTGLSGGEEQRVCLARAILRDPAILILDEATSQVDSESESKIAQAMFALRGGRTIIVIAHRLSTVIGADVIAVMDNGRIVDSGGHDQLLDRCETYRRLIGAQLQPGSA